MEPCGGSSGGGKGRESEPRGRARGAVLAAGEQAAPGQWPWENVATLAPREPARPCRQSAVHTTQLQRPTPAKKVLSAQC